MPEISKQFRELESFFETQEPTDRIAFLGSDVSVVTPYDLWTLSLTQVTHVIASAVGPLVDALFATVPAGNYQTIYFAHLFHNDPAPLNINCQIREISSNLFVHIRPTVVALASGFIAQAFSGRPLIVPPGWRFEARFNGIAGGSQGDLNAMSIIRPIGTTAPVP